MGLVLACSAHVDPNGGTAAAPTAVARIRRQGSHRWSGHLALLAKLGVTLAILGYIISRADLQGVGAAVVTMSPSGLALAACSFLLIPLWGGVRWWAALRALDRDARIFPLTVIFSVAMMLAQVLPTVAGDGLRALLAVRRGHTMQTTLHSILLERVLMLLALLGIALVCEPLFAARVALGPAEWLLPALFLGGLTGVTVLMLADRVGGPLARLRVFRFVRDLSADTRKLVLSPWGVTLLGAGIASNLSFVLMATLLSRAMGLSASVADFLAFMPLVILASILPISLGGWGVREGILVALLGAVGVPSGQALALSLLFGGGNMVAALPGTAVWWFLRQRRIAMPAHG